MLTEPINSRMVGPASSSNALRVRGGVEREVHLSPGWA